MKMTFDIVRPTIHLSGTVTELASALPLAGVLVRWVAPGFESDQFYSEHLPFLSLGSALSDADGDFRIQPDERVEVQRFLSLLPFEPDKRTFVGVFDKNGQVLSELLPVTPQEPAYHLKINTDATPLENNNWNEIAEYLQMRRAFQVQDLVDQLTNPPADSPVQFWNTALRASALKQLQEAAVPATITALAFAGPSSNALTERYNILDLNKLRSGDLGPALNVYANEMAFVPVDRGILLEEMVQDDEQTYRDYLISVWVSVAKRMYETVLTTDSNPVLIDQLASRFFQDFRTADNAAQPAALLCARVLEKALLAPADRGGLGFAGLLPDQGGLSGAAYLRVLVDLSGLGYRELKNRFRIGFNRTDNESLSPVQLNIEALQGVFSDSFQSLVEPFPAQPAADENNYPLIFKASFDVAFANGVAPFYLKYDEWRSTQRIIPENLYDIRKNVPVWTEDWRQEIIANSTASPRGFEHSGFFLNERGIKESVEWIAGLFPVNDLLQQAFAKFDLQLYQEALRMLDDADRLIHKTIENYDSKWLREHFWWFYLPHNGNEIIPLYDRKINFKYREKWSARNLERLEKFENYYAPKAVSDNHQGTLANVGESRSLYIYAAHYWLFILIPYFKARAQAATGNYDEALRLLGYLTGCEIGVANVQTPAGYGETLHPLYREGNLPYTLRLNFDPGKRQPQIKPILANSMDLPSALLSSSLTIAPFEIRYFQLAQGEIMLEWADQLYRLDDGASIDRARELFKAVLWMHGSDPEIAPYWDAVPGKEPAGKRLEDYPAIRKNKNPVMRAQVLRAKQALYQMESGLNYYGCHDDMTPTLRYSTLKQAADRLAMAAKSAQDDFLVFQQHFEQSIIDGWQANALVTKSRAALGIAKEHEALALAEVKKAQNMVEQVRGQIEAKRQEIEDGESLFGQLTDFIGGMKNTIAGLAGPIGSIIQGKGKDAKELELGDMAKVIAAGMKDGIKGAQAAAGPMGALSLGIGAFAIAGYSGIQSLVDKANKRQGEFEHLLNVALPAAEAAVKLRERQVAITRFEQEIASADVEYADTLVRFQRDRFLNTGLWQNLANFANRLLRRYVDTGARFAWLAERALAFEQSRDIRIIRFNYLPAGLRGLTGADRLQADLAELESGRLQALRLGVPVKHVISLAKEFPLEFGQIKKTGHCRIYTTELPLQLAYPGAFGFRVRSITALSQYAGGPPPVGMLRNDGVSVVSGKKWGELNVLTRFPDALPLSEFRLKDDMLVYGLPGESYLPFEGSGFESFWEIELPLETNAFSLPALTDLLLVFDMNAGYDSDRQRLQIPPGSPKERAFLVAASALDANGLSRLQEPDTPKELSFDIRKLNLPGQDGSRQLVNIAVMCISNTAFSGTAGIRPADRGQETVFDIANGIAFSNNEGWKTTPLEMPLNDLRGANLDQVFHLRLPDGAPGSEQDPGSLSDVVLLLEYRTIVQ
jgi:hypothetical protein